jgi:hypothetical protein
MSEPTEDPTPAPNIQDAIDKLLLDLSDHSAHADEYAKMVVQLERLHAMKETEKPKSLSPDTLAIVLGNVVGILLIVGHERMNIVSSKALMFVLKSPK